MSSDFKNANASVKKTISKLLSIYFLSCQSKGKKKFRYNETLVLVRFLGNHSLRWSIAAVWAFEIRQPITEVDDCNIADDLFISQIYNVRLEQKLNIFTAAEAYNVQPKLLQYGCCAKFICQPILQVNHLLKQDQYKLNLLMIYLIFFLSLNNASQYQQSALLLQF